VNEHPVQLVVEDDLRRNRWTVFFRLILAIPHFVWVELWTIAMIFATIANWFATLITGTPSKGLHRFASSYVRYVVHLSAYLGLVGNPYPGFTGIEDEYSVDVRLPPPSRQNRWKTFFRIFLAIPAMLLAGALGGTVPFWIPSRRGYGGGGGGALAFVTGFLGWFASLFRGEMPKGLRDAGAYSVGYRAQVLAYLTLVTDHYPNADPTVLLTDVGRPAEHPVRLVGDPHDLRFSRVTVFFRVLLALPHLVWLELWSIAVAVTTFINWFVTLFTGTPAAPLHRFAARYVRYTFHVSAFLALAANPFPGFVGEPGSYPLDLELPAPERQNKWKTFFRIVLVVPALLISFVLLWGLFFAAVLTWFVALVRGAAPWGLRNYSAYALRYAAQHNAYHYLLTDRYPDSSPLEGAATPQHEFDEAA
jgi:uncharacterized protein DUF4389